MDKLLKDISDADLKLAQDGYYIFANVFIKRNGRKFIDFANFAHKHFHNPHTLEKNCYIEYIKDEPVACIWFIGAEFIVDGKKVMVAHSGDYAATDNATAFCALRVVRDSNKGLAKEGLLFRYSESNDEGLAAEKFFDYRHIGNLASMTLDDASNKISSFDLSKDAGCFEIKRTSSCPFNQADYEQMNADEGLVKPLKSPEYFSYRIDGLAERNFSYLTARKDEKLVGYLVIEQMPKSIRIVDWDLFVVDEEASKILLALLKEGYAGGWTTGCTDDCNDIEKITVSHINDFRGEQSAFEKAGFKITGHGCKICIMGLSEDTPESVYEISNWKLRLLDRDYFLNTYPI